MACEKNWVEQRKQAENHLTAKSATLWQDVKAAIEDASRSFNELYGKELGSKSSTSPTNDHRLRVTLTLLGINKELVVDVDFNREENTITANYTSGGRHKKYKMSADLESAFLTEAEGGERIEADEVSRQILEHLFFPTASVYNKRGLLTT